jgi:hypothetical protein
MESFRFVLNDGDNPLNGVEGNSFASDLYKRWDQIGFMADKSRNAESCPQVLDRTLHIAVVGTNLSPKVQHVYDLFDAREFRKQHGGPEIPVPMKV